MAIEVSTQRFVRSHGQQPRGWGRWGFFVDCSEEPWFVPHSVPYSEAKRLAKLEAKRRNSDYVIVAP